MNNPLSGLPLIESPLLPKLLPCLELNAEEERIALDLHERGYAVLNFPDPEIEGRMTRVRENLTPRFHGIDFADHDSDKTLGDRRIQDAWKFDDDVRAIAVNEKMLALLSKLYGRKAFPFQTLNFPVGTQQEAHTDAVHFSSIPDRFMCGVWLAMEDVGPEAGPLFYLSGSHRWPRMTNEMVGRRGYGSKLPSPQQPFETAWRALRQAHGAIEEPFLARRGQALIWTANLLHGGSHQVNSTLTRWSQVTHYYFDDCIYFTPAFSDEAMGRLDLRRITAIHDGLPRPNMYMGEKVRSHATLRSSVKKVVEGVRRFAVSKLG